MTLRPLPHVWLPALLASLSSLAAAAPVDFVQDIQPLFEKHCWKCHGGSKQEAAFRLDHRPSAMKGGDFGPAIIPGDPDHSRLIHAVRGDNPKKQMPRKAPPLSSADVALLTRWIAEGAVWPESASVALEDKSDHWAFRPPVRPTVPDGVRSPIDFFIDEKLAPQHLNRSPEAPPETLIRRASLDLIGLPPSPAEVHAFTTAYARAPETAWGELIDRLLASPHYGERWGRHWLDAARYADSTGYEKDMMRFIWYYRDWVVRAFNRDLPYDRFIIDQLAGDQLPHPTQDQIVATGFLRNSMLNEEGGVHPEQFRMEAMFDRMDALGKSVLGLTLNCVQCHDHKYDPISQREYYQIFAFLNNDNEPGRVVYSRAEEKSAEAVRTKLDQIDREFKKSHPDWRQRVEKWAGETTKALPTWTPIDFVDEFAGGEKVLPQPDGSLLAQGYAPTRSDTNLIAKSPANIWEGKAITALRLELMNDANLPAYGPGRSLRGTCALTEFSVSLIPSEGGTAKPISVDLTRATADYGEPENTPLVSFARREDESKEDRVTGPIQYAIDKDPKTAWGIDQGPGRRNQPRNAVFELKAPLVVPPGMDLQVTLSAKHGGDNSDDLETMNLGRYRISWTTAAQAQADPLPAAARQKVTEGKLTEPDVLRSFVSSQRDLAETAARYEAAWKEFPEGATTLVLDARSQPRVTHVLKRGDYLSPGDIVEPAVPAVLNPLPARADSSRLSLARWLVDDRAPTTARAYVNRVWQAYFGVGLVDTPEDLGTQGSPPTHPHLLDWLACEFMHPSDPSAKPWSVKHLHRLITQSATYRQSSVTRPELLERDPYNRLLARGPRFRVEGEIVRDIQFAVSGLLNPKMGGPPVMPPAPAFLFERPASYANFPWVDAEGRDRYRRSIYTFRRRSTPFPFLATFDVPTGESSCVARARSNTPMQALMTLNEPLSMQAAEALGRRMRKEGGGTADERLRYGFELCTARPPTESELSTLRQLLRRPQEAEGAVSPWTLVARVLLNLDETVTKD
ncbi:MAG: PSD1 domain-containing protein [Verrucomicrobiales bacterium]|nr:PSD1 domain-containing protein [Verrucomicrobiales bacterium]